MTKPSPAFPPGSLSRRTGVGLFLGLVAGVPVIANATSWRVPEFLIYFPSGSAVLSPAAMSVVRDAKAYFDGSRTGPNARNTWCQVIGGVDGAEFSKGLQPLASERAASVGRALQTLGLASGDRFLTRRPGPSPFAPGRSGAAEDFNRAVMIALHFGMAPIAN